MPPKRNIKSKTVLPDHLPKGEILQDVAKNKWCLGPSIGVGGFGEIYSAASIKDGAKTDKSAYKYVIKIEPHGNGPLFCEMHFFMRNAKPHMIKEWCAKRKVSHDIGMPKYFGSGSHEHDGKKYRFLVMELFGKDLWHIFNENNRKFPVPTVFSIALQIIDVLEYIHSNGYVHADIKGANILLGLSTKNQVFLVDFGLATHYTKKAEYKPDPKKAHNGTIEYTSRDAHDGVFTRRGDLEILAYNMIQWLGCKLPWEDHLKQVQTVQASKQKSMKDIDGFLNTCFGSKAKIPDALTEFLSYINKMNYDTEPDYKKIRSILKSGGGSSSGPLNFGKSEETTETPEKRKKLTPKKKVKTPIRANKKPDSKKNTPTVDDVETEELNGYTAEMLRLQKKIAQRKVTRNGKRKSDSDDIVDGTPPEQLKVKRTNPQNLQATPRTLRTQKRTLYTE